MADLSFEVALALANGLTNIGHPYCHDAIKATALNLMKWCKGNLDKRWSPEEQAERLIEEATLWEEGWPERGGTAALHRLFRASYAPKDKSPAGPQGDTIASLIARGVLALPCKFCRAGEESCQYGGPGNHERYEKEREAAEQRRDSKGPRTKINGRLLLVNRQEIYEDEQRRKEEQLQELGLA